MFYSIRWRKHGTPGLLAAIASIVLPLLSSCDGADSSKESNSPSIEGSWPSPCRKEPSNEETWYQVRVTSSSSERFESINCANSPAICPDAKLNVLRSRMGRTTRNRADSIRKYWTSLGGPLRTKAWPSNTPCVPRLSLQKEKKLLWNPASP